MRLCLPFVLDHVLICFQRGKLARRSRTASARCVSDARRRRNRARLSAGRGSSTTLTSTAPSRLTRVFASRASCSATSPASACPSARNCSTPSPLSTLPTSSPGVPSVRAPQSRSSTESLPAVSPSRSVSKTAQTAASVVLRFDRGPTEAHSPSTRADDGRRRCHALCVKSPRLHGCHRARSRCHRKNPREPGAAAPVTSSAAAVVNKAVPQDVHVILRGGTKGPNFAAEHVKAAASSIEKARPQHHPSIMIDCSRTSPSAVCRTTRPSRR